MDVSQVRSPVNMKKKFPVHTPNLCKFARWHSFSIEAKRSSKEIKEDTAFHQEDIVHIYISLRLSPYWQKRTDHHHGMSEWLILGSIKD
ncbi:uncharacterized protein LOC143434569 isoform X3 [Arvicanthis niloticus]|uniref:uncharacterized protein LOC143308869 isoform X3 n=1 Tax=Arvicanthis niloticus TaxID=61156 RepID=UPI00402B142F